MILRVKGNLLVSASVVSATSQSVFHVAKVPRSSPIPNPRQRSPLQSFVMAEDEYNDELDDDYDEYEDKTEDGDLPPLVEACVALHEIYLALLDGGFTEREALRIIALAMAEGELAE